MAEAALAAVGATTSVIQLGDAALRLCRSISHFIGELKDTKDDMRHLHSTLDDTISLMRDLIAYIHEFQSVTSTNVDHEVLPDAVVSAVQYFHESVAALRGCLPPNLSPSFARKFRFVFNKRKVRSAVKRLEECKASASLALNIVGSRSNIKLRNDLDILRALSEAMTAEQKGGARESSQQRSQLIDAIQDVSQQQSEILPTLERVDQRTLDMTMQLQSICSMVAAQRVRLRSLQSVKTFSAVDEDTLAKLVRMFVTQTVQMVSPGMDREVTSTVDNLGSYVASEAYHDGFFSMKVGEGLQASAPISIPTVDTIAGKGVVMSSEMKPESPVQNQRRVPRSRMVQLFTRDKTIKLKWMLIKFSVIGLRRQQTDSYDSTSYFSIDINVIPRRFISFGVALSYTNAPDDAGYYSICPRILTFGIIPNNPPLRNVLRKDNVDTLRRMIMNREINVRDHDTLGRSLFELAMNHLAVNCCRYLRNEIGIFTLTFFDTTYINDLLTQSVIIVILLNVKAVQKSTSTIPQLSSYERIVCGLHIPSRINELYYLLRWEPDVPTIDTNIWADLLAVSLWVGRLVSGPTCLPLFEDEIGILKVFYDFNIHLDAFHCRLVFGPSGPHHINCYGFCVYLYLKSGGDPNALLQSKPCP
ncbi:hypothetical protein F4677DRAFT_81495 [Hypoxylon crocopeplum]|nr:hypothetical protein F4677DRAFT_81495 [Hypoxylon crocopeplum]